MVIKFFLTVTVDLTMVLLFGKVDGIPPRRSHELTFDPQFSQIFQDGQEITCQQADFLFFYVISKNVSFHVFSIEMYYSRL